MRNAGLLRPLAQTAASLRLGRTTRRYPRRPIATQLQPGLLDDEMGQGKCLACHLCESACPTGCLYIEGEPAQVQDREKRPRVVRLILPGVYSADSVLTLVQKGRLRWWHAIDLVVI